MNSHVDAANRSIDDAAAAAKAAVAELARHVHDAGEKLKATGENVVKGAE